MKNKLKDMEAEILATLESEGFDIVDAHFGGGGFLRLVVDQEGGVPVDECVRAVKLVRSLVYEKGLDPGDFRFEVESPGIDRPLTRPKDFERYQGERVRLTLKEARAEDGRKNYSGVLLDASDSAISIDVDDIGSMDFDRSEVEIVRLNPTLGTKRGEGET